MALIYFAHPYRPPGDKEISDHFAELIQSEGFVISLDPPSDRLNAAKPERRIRSTDALVAVLTARESGPSRYILFEIMLAIRARKPIIVFVEDSLPDHCIPYWLLQRRFSRRSLLLDIGSHRHGIQILKSYTGTDHRPLYQPDFLRRNCLVIAGRNFRGLPERATLSQIDAMQYSSVVIDGDIEARLYDQSFHEKLRAAAFALIILDTGRRYNGFLAGCVAGNMIPAIILTPDQNYRYSEGVPREYQPRLVNLSDAERLTEVIGREVSTFEEDYVDLKDKAEVAAYSRALLDTIRRPGQYPADLRDIIIGRIAVATNNFNNFGQAGAIGPQASGTIVNQQNVAINNVQQIWSTIEPEVDLPQLALELGKLRETLVENAATPEHDQAIMAVGEAQLTARRGDGPGTLRKLAGAGTWALGLAKEIGVKIAAEVMSKSLGF